MEIPKTDLYAQALCLLDRLKLNQVAHWDEQPCACPALGLSEKQVAALSGAAITTALLALAAELRALRLGDR